MRLRIPRPQSLPCRNAALTRPQSRPQTRPETSLGSPLRNILRQGPQAKLRVGRVDAPEEKQADRTADTVMRMPAPHSRTAPRRQAGTEPAAVAKETGMAPSHGKALPAPALDFFESRFGRSFGGVRVHSGSDAAAAAQALDARAFTVGRDVFFNQAEYQPASVEGRRLLAHELAHVAQGGAPDTVRRTPNLLHVLCGQYQQFPGGSLA